MHSVSDDTPKDKLGLVVACIERSIAVLATFRIMSC